MVASLVPVGGSDDFDGGGTDGTAVVDITEVLECTISRDYRSTQCFH